MNFQFGVSNESHNSSNHLQCVSYFIAPPDFSENQVIIKIKSHSCYPINLWPIRIRKSKRNSKWMTQKNWAFQVPPILNIFSRKFHRLVFGLVLSRINWCQWHQCGSTYMVVRLSNISSILCKNDFSCFLHEIELTSDSLMNI